MVLMRPTHLRVVVAMLAPMLEVVMLAVVMLAVVMAVAAAAAAAAAVSISPDRTLSRSWCCGARSARPAAMRGTATPAASTPSRRFEFLVNDPTDMGLSAVGDRACHDPHGR